MPKTATHAKKTTTSTRTLRAVGGSLANLSEKEARQARRAVRRARACSRFPDALRSDDVGVESAICFLRCLSLLHLRLPLRLHGADDLSGLEVDVADVRGRLQS